MAHFRREGSIGFGLETSVYTRLRISLNARRKENTHKNQRFVVGFDQSLDVGGLRLTIENDSLNGRRDKSSYSTTTSSIFDLANLALEYAISIRSTGISLAVRSASLGRRDAGGILGIVERSRASKPTRDKQCRKKHNPRIRERRYALRS
jgi:hypothetical protein